MTAVSTQQTPPPPLLPNRNSSASSRPPPTHDRHHHTAANDLLATGTAMAFRSELNGSSAPAVEVNGDASRARPMTNGRSSHDASVNGDDDPRPSSAPGRRNGALILDARDDIEPQRVQRPMKPLLLRSKSEYAHRALEDPEPMEDDIPEWGARHGFEDHYQSEDIISQLANVSYKFYSISVHSSRCHIFMWYMRLWLQQLDDDGNVVFWHTSRSNLLGSVVEFLASPVVTSPRVMFRSSLGRVSPQPDLGTHLGLCNWVQ